MSKTKRVKIAIFYAHTESGDQYLAILPHKMTAAEFKEYCREEYPDDFEAGTLYGRQILLEIGQGTQL